MKKTKLILTYLLIVFSSYLVAQPVIGMTTFFTNTTTPINPSTACVTTKTCVLSGWLFSVSSTSNCGQNWTNSTGGDGRFQNLVNFGTLTQITFGSSDGSEFALQNLTWGVSTSSWTTKSMTFTGYKNGLAVPNATMNATTPSGTGILNTLVINFTSIAGFNDVDEVRLSPAPGFTCNSILFFEDITIGTACSSTTLNTVGVNNVLCNGGSTGSATISASGSSPFTYTWSPSGGNAATATGLSVGSYTCAVTNSCGTTSSQIVNITEPPPLASFTAATNPLCNGNNGSATVTASGGTAPYTYTWSSAPTTSVEPTLLAGTYTVKVTDNNGCSSTKSVTITQPSALVTSTAVTNVLCNGGSNGSATVTASGGTGAYTYLWSTAATTSVITGQVVGVKTVTVTDANFCTSTKTIIITQPSAINTGTTVTNILCFGNSTGSATVTTSGGSAPYTYLWSGAQTTSVISGQPAGAKTVTVTDNNGCTKTATTIITQPTSALATSTAVTNVLCFGGSTGATTVTASGGTSPYSYLWSGAQTTSVTSGQTAGVKTVTVTDANSCTKTNTITITQPVALNLTASGTSTICQGANAFLGASATGGTGSISYTWNPGTLAGASQTVTPSSNQVYTVIASDANNCTTNTTQTVSVNTVPAISVNSGSICPTQTFVITPSGASTYTISGGSFNVSPAFTSTYAVSGTNAQGCVGAMVISTVNVNATPTIAVASTTICSGATGTLVASGANTYTWSSGANTSSISDNPTINTTYTVNGTSINGCVGIPTTATISVGSAPSIALTSVSVCAGNSATLTASGVTTYTWNTGANTASIVVTPTTNTTYTVNGNLVGCGVAASNTGTVTVNALPSVMAMTSNTLICSGSSVNLSAMGAATYTWNTGSNLTTIAVSPTTTTTYTLMGTDVNGCMNSTSITQNVSTCTSINNLSSNISNFLVYPNPTNGILTIELAHSTSSGQANLNENTKIEITNSLGEIVLTENLSIQHSMFNIHHFSDGVYFVKVISGNDQTTKRLIINK